MARRYQTLVRAHPGVTETTQWDGADTWRLAAFLVTHHGFAALQYRYDKGEVQVAAWAGGCYWTARILPPPDMANAIRRVKKLLREWASVSEPEQFADERRPWSAPKEQSDENP